MAVLMVERLDWLVPRLVDKKENLKVVLSVHQMVDV
jgi:hypothetical protein